MFFYVDPIDKRVHCRIIFQAIFPKEPYYYVANDLHRGLRAYLSNESKQKLFNITKDEKLQKEGGIVTLSGKLRVTGWSKSGKSVFAEIES